MCSTLADEEQDILSRMGGLGRGIAAAVSAAVASYPSRGGGGVEAAHLTRRISSRS
jgi:hypothetical protein